MNVKWSFFLSEIIFEMRILMYIYIDLLVFSICLLLYLFVCVLFIDTFIFRGIG